LYQGQVKNNLRRGDAAAVTPKKCFFCAKDATAGTDLCFFSQSAPANEIFFFFFAAAKRKARHCTKKKKKKRGRSPSFPSFGLPFLFFFLFLWLVPRNLNSIRQNARYAIFLCVTFRKGSHPLPLRILAHY
jgi:hypothetical protein